MPGYVTIKPTVKGGGGPTPSCLLYNEEVKILHLEPFPGAWMGGTHPCARASLPVH